MNLSPSKRRKQKDIAGAMFTGRGVAPLSSAAPSSSPAFGTPVHPVRPFSISTSKQAPILPILLPAATLRPLAFRTFTKKHSLTLTSSALQELASFIGRHCGSGWREEGLAEKVLEEAARSWKNRNGGVIVDAANPELKEILKTLEGNMSGGRVVTGARGLSRQNSLLLDAQQEDGDVSNARLGLRPMAALTREESQTSFGMSSLEVDQEQDDEFKDPRQWLKVINALEQPRYIYNVEKKHFERETKKPSLMPPASHKTMVFRNRFNVIHQRLLRNESFQTSAVSAARATSAKKSDPGASAFHKITPIANLLGRHGSQHMLLGMLTVLPTGNLAVSDLTGSIKLDLRQAVAIPEDSSWFTPGMIVLIDGVYEEDEDASAGSKVGLSGSSGVGGVVGGRFQGFLIGQPPCEKRRVTLGVSGPDSDTIGGGFGWIDFLGVGSERATGSRMRRVQQRLLRRPLSEDDPDKGRGRIVVLGEMNLDQPRTLQAVKKVLSGYANEPEGETPLCFVFTGNFTQHAVMARGGSGGSVEYKEYFDSLAAVLAEFPMLLTSATFVFVPGDNDGWASAFSAGAATPLPRKSVPDLFTSRIRRTFASANSEAAKGGQESTGDAIFTSNPSRLSLFGPCHEVVLFRDDISARLRRSVVRLKRPRDAENGDEPPDGEDMDMSGANDAPENGEGEPVPDEMDVDPSTPRKKTKHSEPEVPYDILAARKLVKTVLDQGYLAPFRQSVRPVHWDYAGSMHLYPLPTAMILVDATAPSFCVTYEGCHVMNPGSLLVTGRRVMARWVEYEIGKTGTVREVLF